MLFVKTGPERFKWLVLPAPDLDRPRAAMGAEIAALTTRAGFPGHRQHF